MPKHIEPATTAPAHIVEMAKEAKLPKDRQYEAAKDHEYEYAAAKCVNHESDAAREWAYKAVVAGGTKKEIQWAFGFHTPMDVTRAAYAYANAKGLTGHKKFNRMGQGSGAKKVAEDPAIALAKNIDAMLEGKLITEKQAAAMRAKLPAPAPVPEAEAPTAPEAPQPETPEPAAPEGRKVTAASGVKKTPAKKAATPRKRAEKKAAEAEGEAQEKVPA